MPFKISLISISSEKRVQGLQVLNFETHEFDFLPATDLENLGKQRWNSDISFFMVKPQEICIVNFFSNHLIFIFKITQRSNMIEESSMDFSSQGNHFLPHHRSPGVPDSWLLHWKSPDQLEDSSLAFLEKPTFFLESKKNKHRKFSRKKTQHLQLQPKISPYLFGVMFWVAHPIFCCRCWKLIAKCSRLGVSSLATWGVCRESLPETKSKRHWK